MYCKSVNADELDKGTQMEKTPVVDLLAFAKGIAERVEAEARRVQVPVAVCVIDSHGNTILQHRMSGAPVFSIELSERKAYTSALVRMRTAEILPLVQPGQPLFPLLSQSKYCAMGGGAPLTDDDRVVAGVGVSGGTVEEDVAILETAIRDDQRAPPDHIDLSSASAGSMPAE